jgi:glycosyltransferase involved in cell wall biosynthesis
VRVLLANSERGLRGGELQTIALGLGLGEKGHEVRLAARRGSRIVEQASDRIPCRFFAFESVPLVTPAAIAGLIASWKPDILHAHTSTAHTHLWIARRLASNPPPLVVSRRVAFRVSRGVSGMLKYRTGVAHYIPISRAAAEGLRAVGVDENRMTIIPSGIDVASFRESSGDRDFLAAAGVGTEKLCIGTVAAYEREKGLEILIDAAREVTARRPGARFVILGGGRLEKRLKRRIDGMGLCDRVHLVRQDRPLERVLPLFDIFVLPSLEEGLSSALLAALASGLPVVASDTGGIPEVIGGGYGILVPPGDAQALAGALLKLIDDGELRAALASSAALRALDFDITATIDRTVEVYHSVLGNES